MTEDLHVQVLGGLCNRLRVLVSFLCAARRQNGKLFVYWHSNHLCPAWFEELFEAPPIDCTVRREPGPPGTYVTGHRHPGVRIVEWAPLVDATLRPAPALQRRTSKILERLGKDFTALHIRRTDHNSSYEEDHAFVEFARQSPGKVFIAADNPQSVATIQERLGDRAIHAATFRKTGKRLTSVQDAVVDLWVARHASRFKGTYYSSFSEWIEMLRVGEPGDLSPLTGDQRRAGVIPPLATRRRIQSAVAMQSPES